MKKILIMVAVLVALGGCSNETRLQNCIRKAANAPTERGVSMAQNSCYDRFREYVQKRNSERRQSVEERRNEEFKEIIKDILDKRKRGGNPSGDNL